MFGGDICQLHVDVEVLGWEGLLLHKLRLVRLLVIFFITVGCYEGPSPSTAPRFRGYGWAATDQHSVFPFTWLLRAFSELAVAGCPGRSLEGPACGALAFGVPACWPFAGCSSSGRSVFAFCCQSIVGDRCLVCVV